MPELDPNCIYLKFWRALFENVLGWTDQDVEQFALGWVKSGYLDDDSMFYHESPLYYALVVFLRNKRNERTRRSLQGMLMERLLPVEKAMLAGDSIDWTRVKADIAKIVRLRNQGKIR